MKGSSMNTLMEADADLEKVLVIDDRDTPLTLADERIARDVYKRQPPSVPALPHRLAEQRYCAVPGTPL